MSAKERRIAWRGIIDQRRTLIKEEAMLPMAGELVRHLVVELIPAEELAPVLAGEGSRSFPLEGQLQEEYAEWDLVSHTFALRDDDSAVVALVLEQKARRAN